MINASRANGSLKMLTLATTLLRALLVSIYGKNFHFMPEPDWRVACPPTMPGMLLSAIIPSFVFRWKGWL